MHVLFFIALFIVPLGPPTNFTAVLNDTVLSLNWEPPAEDEQNGDITSYFLQCSIDDEVVFQLNLTIIQSIELGVYEVDSTYSCSIYASNSIGEGSSAYVTVTTGNKIDNEITSESEN